MDWQHVEDTLRSWVTSSLGCAPHLVAWDRAPVEFRNYIQVDLRLFDHRARSGLTPQVFYPTPSDPSAPILPTAAADRACTWSITLTTRDHHANAKAYVPLDRLAVLLELPTTVEAFAAAGIAILGSGGVITSAFPTAEHRDLSQATLRVELGYVLEVTAPPEGAIEIIEHAEVTGTVYHETEAIPVPPNMMPDQEVA